METVSLARRCRFERPFPMGCAASSEAPTTAHPATSARQQTLHAHPRASVLAESVSHTVDEVDEVAAVASLSFHPDPELEASPPWSPCDGDSEAIGDAPQDVAARRHRSVSEVMSANAHQGSGDVHNPATNTGRRRTPARESWRRQRLAAMAVAHGMTSDVHQFTAPPVPQATVAASRQACADWLQRVDSVHSQTTQ